MERNLSVEDVREDILKLDEVLQTAISDNSRAHSKQKRTKKEATSSAFHVGMKSVAIKCEKPEEERGHVGCQLPWTLHHHYCCS